MKAMIFAAGLGTRLRPLTDTMPKALVPVNGKAAIAHVIDGLHAQGVDSFVVNVHHFADKVKSFLAQQYPDLQIEISDETDQLLDTGGGLLAAADYLADESRFILHNSDILTNVPLREMLEYHNSSDADVTLLVNERTSTRRLMFDEDNRLRGWMNMANGARLPEDASFDGCHPAAFGGVHIISGKALKTLRETYSRNTAFPIIPFYVNNANRLNIRAYKPESQIYWFDIGTIEKLTNASNYLKNL